MPDKCGSPNDTMSMGVEVSQSESVYEVSSGSSIHIIEPPEAESEMALRCCPDLVSSDIERSRPGRSSNPLASYPSANRSWVSVFEEKDVPKIRESYNLPPSVVLRAPLPTERADCNGPNEVLVHEAFFASGLREAVPSLIAELATHFHISPGQLTPQTWRVLTAIQVFGELYSVNLGVKEILYVYFLRSYELDNSRYVIQRRSKCTTPLVYDLTRSEVRRLSHEKNWQKKFLFMRVNDNFAFPVTWFPRDLSKVPRCKEGESNVLKAFSYPKDCRSVKFLLSFFALEKTTIWGYKMSSFDGSIGDGALEQFRQAAGVISAPTVVAFSGEEAPATNQLPRHGLPTSEGFGLQTRSVRQRVLSSSQGAMSATPSHSTALETLKKKVFPSDCDAFTQLGYVEILEKSQAHLLKVMSVCHHVKAELEASNKEASRLHNDNIMLMKEKECHDSAIAARDEEIAFLKNQVVDLQAKNESLTETNKTLLEKVDCLARKVKMAVGAATIHCTWKMIREYKAGLAHNWKANQAELDYREIMITEAELENKPRPVFPESLTYGDEDSAPAAV